MSTNASAVTNQTTSLQQTFIDKVSLPLKITFVVCTVLGLIGASLAYFGGVGTIGFHFFEVPTKTFLIGMGSIAFIVLSILTINRCFYQKRQEALEPAIKSEFQKPDIPKITIPLPGSPPSPMSSPDRECERTPRHDETEDDSGYDASLSSGSLSLKSQASELDDESGDRNTAIFHPIDSDQLPSLDITPTGTKDLPIHHPYSDDPVDPGSPSFQKCLKVTDGETESELTRREWEAVLSLEEIELYRENTRQSIQAKTSIDGALSSYEGEHNKFHQLILKGSIRFFGHLLSSTDFSEQIEKLINSQTKETQQTALHLLANQRYGNPPHSDRESIRLFYFFKLLIHDCNFNIQDTDGNTPLHLAAKNLNVLMQKEEVAQEEIRDQLRFYLLLFQHTNSSLTNSSGFKADELLPDNFNQEIFKEAEIQAKKFYLDHIDEFPEDFLDAQVLEKINQSTECTKETGLHLFAKQTGLDLHHEELYTFKGMNYQRLFYLIKLVNDKIKIDLPDHQGNTPLHVAAAELNTLMNTRNLPITESYKNITVKVDFGKSIALKRRKESHVNERKRTRVPRNFKIEQYAFYLLLKHLIDRSTINSKGQKAEDLLPTNLAQIEKEAKKRVRRICRKFEIVLDKPKI